MNEWSSMEEARMKEENPLEYKRLKKHGELDDYLESYGREAKEVECDVYRHLDAKMVLEDEDKLTESQRKSRIAAIARDFMMSKD